MRRRPDEEQESAVVGRGWVIGGLAGGLIWLLIIYLVISLLK